MAQLCVQSVDGDVKCPGAEAGDGESGGVLEVGAGGVEVDVLRRGEGGHGAYAAAVAD